MLNLIVILLLSYLMGSLPTSIIVARITKGIDIRQYGSGNAGGTNSFRVLGWKAGLFVSLVDIGKGTFATLVISTLRFGELPFESQSAVMILAGLAAILGHTYTIFAGFKGGKGVATGAGMLLGLFPVAFLICLLVFAVVLFTTGTVSLSSISAAVSLPIALFLLDQFTSAEVDAVLKGVSLIIPLFIIFTHRTNIRRLLKGEENSFEKLKIFRSKKA
ncbi:MAG: glycerol-3-phosphate 1-O-acyltransferase PlsY [Candidatus Marinimicrobia bacterium]|nr:glycerol-3-phosphate 1-O-acyltransferase PlsY [Candidatus Neomarinimicrobiota bacterium]RKY61506.1 MAG: acyl-phosphate glycerol 3-phosphate acyltransferase [Candidatus Neomarinimicrobiota bacterium]